MKTTSRKNTRTFGQVPAQHPWGFTSGTTSGILEVDPAQAAVLAALLQHAVAEYYSYDRRLRGAHEEPIQIAIDYGEAAPHIRVQRSRNRMLKPLKRSA